jgi:hypothetical protein
MSDRSRDLNGKFINEPAIENEKLSEKLKSLAESIIDDAAGQPFDQRIAALKAVTTLHLGLAKISGKLPPEEDESIGLPAMRAALKAVAEGEGK